jgi:membrane protein
VVALAVASSLFDDASVRQQLATQVELLTGPRTREVVLALVDHTRRSDASPLAALVGLGTLLFGAVRIFEALRTALNQVWGVETEHGGWRAMLHERLVAFLLLLGTGILLVASLITSAALSVVSQAAARALPQELAALSLPRFVGSQPLGEVMASLRLADGLVSFLVTALVFAVLFRVLPDCEVAWRDAAVGAITTAVLFQLGRIGIGFYLAHAGVASTYGAAGSLVVLLLWVFYSAQIFLFGAQFTWVYATELGSRAQARRVRAEERGAVAAGGS